MQILNLTSKRILVEMNPMELFTSCLVSISSSSPPSPLFNVYPAVKIHASNAALTLRTPCPLPLSSSSLYSKPISRKTFPCTLMASPTQKYVYPDPSPEFAQLEIQKFRVELSKKLSEDVDEFGDDLDAVVDVCAQIFNEFLHNEYGGPGTLLVEPFTDMLVALKRKKLPGAPLAARASLLWAQNYLDEDWEVWNSKLK